jgi:hypothetical protein
VTRKRPTIDPNLLHDERFTRLSQPAKAVWYHLVFSCPHVGLSLDEICQALVELGDPELLTHLRRYVAERPAPTTRSRRITVSSG